MSCRALLVSVLICLSFSTKAQRDSTASSSTGFVSLYYGTLIGKRGLGPSVSAAMTGGVRHKRVQLGVGFGYDTYSQWQLLPVFATVGYDVLKGRNYAFFIQLQTGYATAWTSRTEDSGVTYRNTGGYFWHPLFGCRVEQRKLRVYFTAGYKLQNLSYEQIPQWIDWGWGGGGYKSNVNMNLQRLSVMLGLGL